MPAFNGRGRRRPLDCDGGRSVAAATFFNSDEGLLGFKVSASLRGLVRDRRAPSGMKECHGALLAAADEDGDTPALRPTMG